MGCDLMFNFNTIVGVHENALSVYSQRAKIISSNLVNADTPNFKARDIDFRNVLKGVESHRVQLVGIHQSTETHETPELVYRVPLQPSLDGNTVNVQQEVSAYSENAVRFQATLNILSNKFKSISKAIRGD